MEIREIKDKNIWENFLSGAKEKTFLQSWNWGEFNKLMGNKIWRLGLYENESLLSTALVIKTIAKRGNFLVLPHGPVIQNSNSLLKTEEQNYNLKFKILKTFLEKLKEIAKKEKMNFIRIAPIWKRTQENIKVFKDLKFRQAPIHLHAEVTWELDINPSEEELLRQMRKTTRYLIRQAQKNKEIEIYQSQNLSDIEIFNKLYQELALRQHFTPFSLEYLKNEFLAFNPDQQISIFFGKYKNEIVSSGIFIFWQKIGFYHQGASLLKYPKIPVSYLLQWEAIREAKKRSCRVFNFWGIAPVEKRSHPWAGLTLFKMGFGGYKKEYVKTQDFPLSKKYWLTFIFEKLRKIKRHL